MKQPVTYSLSPLGEGRGEGPPANPLEGLR